MPDTTTHRPAARHRGRLAHRLRDHRRRLGSIKGEDGSSHRIDVERLTIEPSTCATSRATSWSSIASPTGTTTRASG
jgi:hypothetical protein